MRGENSGKLAAQRERDVRRQLARPVLGLECLDQRRPSRETLETHLRCGLVPSGNPFARLRAGCGAHRRDAQIS